MQKNNNERRRTDPYKIFNTPTTVSSAKVRKKPKTILVQGHNLEQYAQLHILVSLSTKV